MTNCALSTFGFILFVMAFISYYQYCSLSSSLQRIQCMQIWCRFAPRSIEGSYFREQKKKKKKWNRRLEFNAYSATLCFRWRRGRQIKLTLLLILIQLHKVLRFRTMYLQFFHALSCMACKTIFVHLVQ